MPNYSWIRLSYLIGTMLRANPVKRSSTSFFSTRSPKLMLDICETITGVSVTGAAQTRGDSRTALVRTDDFSALPFVDLLRDVSWINACKASFGATIRTSIATLDHNAVAADFAMQAVTFPMPRMIGQIWRCLTVVALLIAFTIALPMPLRAQVAIGSNGSLAGVVQDQAGKPIADASIQLLVGKAVESRRSASGGQFTIDRLAPGEYSMTVRASGFQTTVQPAVEITAGRQTAVTIVLAAVSFSSLRTIGATTTTRSNSLNTSPAAITDIPAQVFTDQGAQQVFGVLNQTPGVAATLGTGSNLPTNGGGMSAVLVPQIRGALPYETESFIDGHPVSVGALGYFSPLYLDPSLLETVEIVKGPGATPPDINNAIGGSINYRTLEPTRDSRESADLRLDSYAGLSTHVKATGTVANGHLGYALAYNIDGTPGPLQNQQIAGVPNALALGLNPTINGVPVCGTPSAGGTCLFNFAANRPNYQSDFRTLDTISGCCSTLTTQYLARTELAKLRYSFSQQTSLTVAYLAAQATYDAGYSFTAPDLFAPPNGYRGSLAPNSPLPNDYSSFLPARESDTEGLLEAELRTSFKPGSLLLRYYTGANDMNYDALGSLTGTYSFKARTWGGLPIGPNGANVFFNGQPESFSVQDAGASIVSRDHFSGLSGEFNIPLGNNVVSLSADRNRHNSYGANLYGVPSSDSIAVPDGSSQAFTTFLARGTFAPTNTLNLTLANYFVSYTSHYTPDGGLTWRDSPHSFYGPRISATDRIGRNAIVRASAGSSIAPPFLALVSTQGGSPTADVNGAPTYYTRTLNNGTIQPETAFGYDLGVDRRLLTNTILSADVYITTLHGQFLASTQADGTYTPTGGINSGLSRPLFLSETSNLGLSQYKGIELSVNSSPRTGFGYRVQGSLQSGAPQKLPPGFYDTGAGQNTTNLGVLSGVNFQPSGSGYNGLGYGRLPYANGYGEMNWRNAKTFYMLGATFYGNNNSYNEPPFAVLNASARWQITPKTSLQLNANNLSGAYSSSFYSLNGGIPVPLKNGLFGATPAINVGPTTFALTLHQGV